VVLAADWSSVERYLVKIGKIDPFIYYIPLIGYPTRQAKYLADILEVSEELFKNERSISKQNDGFSHLKRLSLQAVNNDDSSSYPRASGEVDDSDFVKMDISGSIGQPGSLVDEGAYTIFYNRDDEQCGWIWTSKLRNQVLNRSDDIISKAGASLFIGGFLLQLVAELISIPKYPTIRIPSPLIIVALLFAILSIPGVCKQQKMNEGN